MPAMAKNRGWAGEGRDDVEGGDERPRGGKDRRTSMRMIWNGPGYPLSIFLLGMSCSGLVVKC